MTDCSVVNNYTVVVKVTDLVKVYVVSFSQWMFALVCQMEY